MPDFIRLETALPGPHFGETRILPSAFQIDIDREILLRAADAIHIEDRHDHPNHRRPLIFGNRSRGNISAVRALRTECTKKEPGRENENKEV